MLLDIEVMVIIVICATVVLVSFINAITSAVVCGKMFKAIEKMFEDLGSMFKSEF